MQFPKSLSSIASVAEGARTDGWVKSLPWLVSAALVVLLAWQLVQLAWTLLGARKATPAPAGSVAAGPVAPAPVLDVQAETRVREYRIRLAVSGNADRATVTFLSDPALPDSDILALLALGRRGEELKGKETNVGVGEATSFATGKFQDILESRARSLTGLDRFQVDPYINKQDTAVPRVTVGKELMPEKLHMTYSSNVGGTTPEQNIRVEYFLNRNISLIGEYDELGQLGADLKFRFEFR